MAQQKIQSKPRLIGSSGGGAATLGGGDAEAWLSMLGCIVGFTQKYIVRRI